MGGEGTAMKALLHHDHPDTLAQASRRSKSGRVAQRWLAIRDIRLGRSRAWVCAQYCVRGENLSHWVAWYNAHGRAGLEEAPRAGRPCKLSQRQRAALQARLSLPPELGQDGVGRWRAAAVPRLIGRDCQ
jgi:hypothetical protein